jgi:hypothetical protein
MIFRARGISLDFGRLIYCFVLAFIVCFGIGLLYELWFSPTGSSLSTHQFKDVIMTAAAGVAGMAFAEFIPPIRRTRSKSTE